MNLTTKEMDSHFAFLNSRELSNLTPDNFSQWNYSDFTPIWGHVPPWEKAIKITAFVPVIGLGFFGNLAILSLVVFKREMRTCTNMFIMNMALADLLTSVLSTWIFLIGDFNQNYVLGSFFCKAGGFIQVTCLLSSVFSLMVISMDRLLGIVFPFTKRLTRRVGIFIILLIWIASAGSGYPLIHWRFYNERIWNDYVEKFCTEDMMELKYYWFTILVLLFYLPLCILVIAYTFIILQLDKYQSKLTNCFSPAKLNRKRRILRMLFLYLLCIIICWLLFQVSIFYRYYNVQESLGPLPDWFGPFHFVAYFLAYSNSAINPILYGICNQNFRKAFFSMLPVGYQPTSLSPSNDNRRSVPPMRLSLRPDGNEQRNSCHM